MRIPAIQGIIRRRLLVNFRANPEVVQRHLPAPFRPKLQQGQAVVGICLIRLEHLRPMFVPEFIGFSSENAAHRFAVLWEDKDNVTHEGVFIPRRDTNSTVNYLLGGRLFPGEHHRASFKIDEAGEELKLSVKAAERSMSVKVAGQTGNALPA